MSKEYIERQKILTECDEAISNIQFSSPYQDEIDTMTSGMERIRDIFNDAPTVDAAPIIHAQWEKIEEKNFWIQNMQESLETGKPTKMEIPVCSHCKTSFGTLAFNYIYCPACGARMDGGCGDV